MQPTEGYKGREIDPCIGRGYLPIGLPEQARGGGGAEEGDGARSRWLFLSRVRVREKM